MEKALIEGKHFRLLHESELPNVIDFLAQFLPHSIKFHQTLKTYINDRVWKFYFYVTKTWPEQPIILHFPGMTHTPNNNLYESFSVFCPSDQLEHMQLLEQEDILINWTQPIYLNFTHAKVMEQIECLYTNKGSIEKQYGDVYVLQETPAEMDDITNILLLDNAELHQLKVNHAQTIHELYPAKHLECLQVFQKLIDKLPCYGIFSASGDLAAWMIQSYYGAMFSMQTKPQYRRKGYGLILAKYLTKTVIKRGYIPFVVIRPENEASKSLYIKLGFSKYFESVRAVLRPRNEANESILNNRSSFIEIMENQYL